MGHPRQLIKRVTIEEGVDVDVGEAVNDRDCSSNDRVSDLHGQAQRSCRSGNVDEVAVADMVDCGVDRMDQRLVGLSVSEVLPVHPLHQPARREHKWRPVAGSREML